MYRTGSLRAEICTINLMKNCDEKTMYLYSDINL